jgi:hypothetical protein
MAVHFEEEVLPSRILRVLVEVSEGDVKTSQHTQDLPIVSQLVIGFAGVHTRAREYQHTEALTILPNGPIESSEDVL